MKSSLNLKKVLLNLINYKELIMPSWDNSNLSQVSNSDGAVFKVLFGFWSVVIIGGFGLQTSCTVQLPKTL